MVTDLQCIHDVVEEMGSLGDQDRMRDIEAVIQAAANYDWTYCGIELGHKCAFNETQRVQTMGAEDFGCHWNDGERDRTRYLIVHGPKCPVTKARALLGLEENH